MAWLCYLPCHPFFFFFSPKRGVEESFPSLSYLLVSTLLLLMKSTFTSCQSSLRPLIFSSSSALLARFFLSPFLLYVASIFASFYATDLQSVSLQAKTPSCAFLPAVVPTHDSFTSLALNHTDTNVHKRQRRREKRSCCTTWNEEMKRNQIPHCVRTLFLILCLPDSWFTKSACRSRQP